MHDTVPTPPGTAPAVDDDAEAFALIDSADVSDDIKVGLRRWLVDQRAHHRKQRLGMTVWRLSVNSGDSSPIDVDDGWDVGPVGSGSVR